MFQGQNQYAAYTSSCARHSNGTGATADHRKQSHVGGEALRKARGGPGLVPMGYVSPNGLGQ